jgi:hypothetical protein
VARTVALVVVRVRERSVVVVELVLPSQRRRSRHGPVAPVGPSLADGRQGRRRLLLLLLLLMMMMMMMVVPTASRWRRRRCRCRRRRRCHLGRREGNKVGRRRRDLPATFVRHGVKRCRLSFEKECNFTFQCRGAFLFSGQSVSKRTKARGLFGRLINKKAFSGTGRPPRSDDEEELVDGALRVTIRHAPAIRSTDPFGWIHGEANPKHCQTDLLHRKAGAGTCFRSGKVEARPGRRSPQRFHGMGACAAPIPPNKHDSMKMGARSEAVALVDLFTLSTPLPIDSIPR